MYTKSEEFKSPFIYVWNELRLAGMSRDYRDVIVLEEQRLQIPTV